MIYMYIYIFHMCVCVCVCVCVRGGGPAKDSIGICLEADRRVCMLDRASRYVYAYRRPRCDSRCKERGDVPSRVTRLW
jgi:hypothetical protein